MRSAFEIAGHFFWLAILAGFAGWLFHRSYKRTEERARYLFKWTVTAAVLACYIWVVMPLVRYGGYVAIGGIFFAVALGNILAIVWGHAITEIIAKPFASLYDGGDAEPEAKPAYSAAWSKRMRRNFLEATVDVRQQLDRFPNDMEGVMLLASIQAEDLKDLPGAEITLNHFADQPDAPPKQVAAALTQLADWHLKLAEDVDSARAALEKIVVQFPDTELAAQAAQRLARLGGTEKILLAAHDRQPTFVPEGVKNIGLLESSAHLRPAETDPALLAAAYVKHLEQHPLDTEAREKLAVIYADHYQRLDLATNELEQLIEGPHQPPKRVAHWLNLLADLQIHHGAQYELVRATLGKVVERFPNLPVAEIARSRLGRLKLEFKGQAKMPGVKLGEYEQNIGLKYGSPHKF